MVALEDPAPHETSPQDRQSPSELLRQHLVRERNSIILKKVRQAMVDALRNDTRLMAGFARGSHPFCEVDVSDVARVYRPDEHRELYTMLAVGLNRELRSEGQGASGNVSQSGGSETETSVPQRISEIKDEVLGEDVCREFLKSSECRSILVTAFSAYQYVIHVGNFEKDGVLDVLEGVPLERWKRYALLPQESMRSRTHDDTLPSFRDIPGRVLFGVITFLETYMRGRSGESLLSKQDVLEADRILLRNVQAMWSMYKGTYFVQNEEKFVESLKWTCEQVRQRLLEYTSEQDEPGVEEAWRSTPIEIQTK